MEKKDIIGAFNILKHWYSKFSGRATIPTEEDIGKVRETYVKLFTKDNLTDELPFNFKYDGKRVNDEVPDAEEIRRAVFRMRSRKAAGL